MGNETGNGFTPDKISITSSQAEVAAPVGTA